MARGGELRFAHGVNSRARLAHFLTAPIDVFEVDVSWGFLVGSPNQMLAITAHPPLLQADLSFEEMFETTLESGRVVKIDLKDRMAQDAVLTYLARTEPPPDRFFLNADMVLGPNGMPPIFGPRDGLAWRAALGGDLLVSIGSTTAGPNGPYSDDDVRRLLDAAAEIGEPLTICLDAHRLEVDRGALDAVVAAHRHVSLWNWYPADAAMFQRYRALVSDGFIDLFDRDRAPLT